MPALTIASACSVACQASTSTTPSALPVRQQVTKREENCPVGEALVGSGCEI